MTGQGGRYLAMSWPARPLRVKTTAMQPAHATKGMDGQPRRVFDYCENEPQFAAVEGVGIFATPGFQRSRHPVSAGVGVARVYKDRQWKAVSGFGKQGNLVRWYISEPIVDYFPWPSYPQTRP